MEKTFEEKLQELEKINQNLNQGNLPLEKSLQEFEAGIALSKDCQKTLEAAEKRVRMLTEKEGSWEEKDYAETPENKQAHNLVKEKANTPENKQPQNLVKEYPTNTKPVATENKQPQNPNIPKESLHSTNNKTDFSS